MTTSVKNDVFNDKDGKAEDVRMSNIQAAKAVADAVRTSLGPRGMDKMIQLQKGEVTITNDGATILKQMKVMHPAAKMLVDLSAAQDVEAGDGTTSVVVIAGSLLQACKRLLKKGIHPTTVSESFQKAMNEAKKILTEMSTPVDLDDRELLLQLVRTSLSSKVVSQYADTLCPIIVDAILRITEGADRGMNNVDLRNIKVVNRLGGTVEDTELVDGIVFEQKASHFAGGVGRIEKAKVGLIQFCLSAPKTDMDNSVVISNYAQMDRVLKEERNYILNLCKQIKKSGCNVLLVQKSILRDGVSDLALHFLAKFKIMVIKDIERDEVEFVCKTIGCQPVASVEGFTAEKLGSADLVEEVPTGSSRVVKMTGVANAGKTVSLFVRGSSDLVLAEAERSIHDALCVMRCIVKVKHLISGGGAPEMRCNIKLEKLSESLAGRESVCIKEFAQALEVIPSTLAENAGLNPIVTVTQLRNEHAAGKINSGINVRKGCITDMREENVVQPLLVTLSAFSLATETVRCLLKVDDIVAAR